MRQDGILSIASYLSRNLAVAGGRILISLGTLGANAFSFVAGMEVH
jgi:hypothetical protein